MSNYRNEDLSFLINKYSKKKVSIGRIAEELDLSVNEVLDLLAEFGIESSILYDDYLQGFESLKTFK